MRRFPGGRDHDGDGEDDLVDEKIFELIVFSTSGSKVFKLTVEILVREARGQVQVAPKISFFLPSIREADMREKCSFF